MSRYKFPACLTLFLICTVQTVEFENSTEFNPILVQDDETLNRTTTEYIEILDETTTQNILENVSLSTIINLKTSTPNIEIITDEDIRSTTDNRIELPPNTIPRFEKIASQWYDNIPVLPSVLFEALSHQNSACGRQSTRFMNDLSNFTLWAAEMFDASTKIPSGIWSGREYDMGNFEECIEIFVQTDDVGDVKGKYCLVQFEYGLKNSSSLIQNPFKLFFDPKRSAWEKIQYRNDVTKLRKDKLTWAVCLPNLCNKDDIISSLESRMIPYFDEYGLYFNVTIPKDGCTIKKQEQFSIGDIAYGLVMLLIILFVLCVTIWHYNYEEADITKQSSRFKFFSGFSMITNMKSLLHHSKTNSTLDAMHGFKVALIVMIVNGHRMLQYYGHPLYDGHFMEFTYRTLRYMTIYNGLVIVDGFFAMSGILIAYKLLAEIDKRSHVNLFHAIFLRYIRLTPAYLVVIFFIATFLRHMGDGPFWNLNVVMESERCTETWWHSMLYINNYVNAEHMCMFTSWYLSCDFQMYIIGVLAVYMVGKHEKIGYVILCSLLTASIIIPFIVTYYQQTAAILRLLPSMSDPRQDHFFTHEYIQTHMRMGPFIIGLLVGVLLYKNRDTKFLMSKVWSLVVLITMWVLLHVCELSGYLFFVPDRPYDPFEAALFNTLHRVGFTITITVIIGVIGHSKFKLLQRFFGCWPLVVLSKLTFGVYLVHVVLLIFDLGLQRAPKSFFLQAQIRDVTADTVIAYFFSLLLYLFIESPAKHLTNFVLTKR